MTWLQGSLEHFNLWGWLLHHKIRSLLLSLLPSLPLTALVAPSERGNGNGCPHRCCHCCHSHCHHHCRNNPPLSLPGMHPTKVGCCLKKRDHSHHCYVVVCIVVIGDGLPHCCRHCCHSHLHHHHCRNHSPTLCQECIRPRLVVAKKNKIIAIVVTSLSYLLS